MAMPLAPFRNEIVELNVREFEAEPGLMHRGFNAVSAVDALAAHIYYEIKNQGRDPFEEIGGKSVRGNDDSAFRQELAAKNGAFELLRDIAKANKHAFLDRYEPKINGSDDTKIKVLGYGAGGFGRGAFGNNQQVTVTDVNDNEYSLLSLVLDAVSFLDEVARGRGLF